MWQIKRYNWKSIGGVNVPELHETMIGRRFFENQLPKLINALERIADALEKQNESKEKEKSDDENRS